VLIPVKAFARAKVRLSDVLSADERAALARRMAAQVVAASGPLPVRVVCDDGEVADWAVSVGATVSWTPGRGLNGAVQEAVGHAALDGFGRAVVAHADLPFAADLAALALAAPDEVLLVPDRHGDGTNVLSVPTEAAFRFHYGSGSYRAHLREAARSGLIARTVAAPLLEWDVDVPDDLDTPSDLGPAPITAAGPP
jgi:2-phospho-L-lactate/phosphoenolpyruvate guanylyltransferase